MGEDAPRPPYQLAPPALVFSPPTSKYAPPSLGYISVKSQQCRTQVAFTNKT